MKLSKKLLSLLLCTVMVLSSVTVGTNGIAELLSVKASASNAERDDSFLTYMVSIILNYDYDGAAKIGENTLPNMRYTRFTDLSLATLAKPVVEEMNNDVAFRVSEAAWEVGTFSLSDILTMEDEKIGYYETVLLSIVNASVKCSFIPSAVTQYSKNTTKILKEIAKIKKINLEKASDVNLWNCGLSSEEAHEIYQSFAKEHTRVEMRMQTYQDTAKIIKAYSSATDFVSGLASYASCTDLSENITSVLEELNNHCPSTNMELKMAIEKVNAASESVWNGVAFKTFDVLGDTIETALDELWEGILDSIVGELSAGILIGQAIGQAAANILFSTDQTIEQWYKMNALVTVEETLVDVIFSLEKQFKDCPNSENAQLIISALQLLAEIYIQDYDMSEDLAEYIYEKGLWNHIKKWTLKLFGKYDGSQMEEFHSNIESLKNAVSDLTTILDSAYYENFYALDKGNDTELSENTNIDYMTGKIVTVQCPTDIDVFDSKGNLVLQTRNNDVTVSSFDNYVVIRGDEKWLYLDSNDNYQLEITATGQGAMNYKVYEMLGSSVKRTIEYMNVPIIMNDTFASTVSSNIYQESQLYNLVKNTGEIIECDYDSLPTLDSDIVDVIIAEELFDGFPAELMGAVADAMFNMQASVDVSSYEITTDDLVALFSAIAKYYPSEYSILSKTNFSYRASVSPSLGIVTKLRFFYDEDVNLSDFQRRVKELDTAVQKIVADCKGMSDFEKLLYVHDYILLHAEYDLDLLEMMEAQGTLDGETRSERYTEYSILVNGTGVCGSYALAYRAVLNAMGIDCLYLSSNQMNHAWNLVKLNGKWYHVDVCWDDPVPDTYGRARRTYFLLTDEEIMALSHYSWTPGQYKAADKSFSDMPRGYDITQKLDNNSWYYLKSGSLYQSDIYGKNGEPVCTMSASTFDVDAGKIYYASGKYIYYHSADGNSLVYVIPANKLGSKPERASIKNLYVNGNAAEYYKYIVDENGTGKTVNEKAEMGTESYSGMKGVRLNAAETDINIFDSYQLTASTDDGSSVSGYACEWKSSDNYIAAVSDAGLVTAKNTGSATITFSALGFSASCKVTVTGDGLSGTCGENAVWEFEPENGTLTFSGDGEISTSNWSKCSSAVKKMVIKNDVYFSEGILNGFHAFTSLEAFDVSFWNNYYKDDDSVALLNKEETKLIKYAPKSREGYYEIPNDVVEIREKAFYGSENLQALVIPEGVETVQTGSFSGCKNVKYLLLECGKTAAAAITAQFVNLKKIYIKDVSVDALTLNNSNRITVYAEDSAQVKSFCSENGIKFVSTDADNHAHGYYPKEFVDFTDEKDGEIKWYSFCGGEHYSETVHNYDEGESIPATCISCEKIKRICKNCGYVDISDAVENDYEVGDIIEFGSYPQSEVKDEALLAALNALGGDNKSWVSYNYYSGTGDWSDGQMKPSDYMRYKDVSYNGSQYRAVTFDSYRPYYTGYTHTGGTYQDDNGYTTGNVYWFKYEPIKWRVLDPSAGLIMCDTAIDSQAYNNYIDYSGSEFYGDSACTYHASNYAKSSIRAWLNNDFCNTAFSSAQKTNIIAAALDNCSTDSSTYDAPSTTDKIFLLSYSDLISPNYGFSSEYSSDAAARQLKSTDYAKCQGCYQETSGSYLGNSWWWLRSPNYSGNARGVNRYGNSDYSNISSTDKGVVPALRLNLSSCAFTTQCEVGDIIEFGSYPQSEVKDEALIAALNELGGDNSSWTSYNYYSGTGDRSDGQMKPSDYMRYKDVSYNGSQYRAVTFDSYRPYFTGYTHTGGTGQVDNGYTTGNVYWFKYEPLVWRVLDSSTGLVMCESIIDSQAYNNYIWYGIGSKSTWSEYYSNEAHTNYANDYYNSSIRKWLTEDFYATAFSESQQNKLLNYNCDNSCCSSSFPEYDSQNSSDKVFLLSYDEVKKTEYGFNSDPYEEDPARRAKGTDYARCQGLYVFKSSESEYDGNSFWRLRSPGYYSDYTCFVSDDGYIYIYCGTNDACNGVRPALKLNLKSIISESENLHSPAEPVTENVADSTCKEHGGYDEVIYCSLCGEELERKHISLPLSKRHSFETVEIVEATCTEDGREKLVCSVCGEERTRSLSAVFAHDFVETVVPPTCTQNGYTKAECTLCGEVEFYDFTPPIGHKLTITNEGEYCEAHGTKCYKCSRCDYEEAVVIETDSLQTKTIRTEPTCTQAGSEKEICTLCGATIATVILKPTGHVFADNFTVDKAASCTETGEKSRHCANCEERIFITEIPLVPHSFKDEVIISSCTKQGYTKHSCQNCEYSYCDGYTAINPAAHTVVADEAVAPTCTKTGLTVGSHCAECGITIAAQQVVKPAGHTAGDWEYEGNGYFIQKCDECHETIDSKQVSICFNLDSVSVENGSTKVLKPSVTDEFTTDYSFTSSDNSVATVDSDGKLTAKAVGQCNITVTINGTDISDTVPVTVNAREFKLTFVVDGKEQTAQVKEGTAIKAPAVTVKTGFEWKGWTPAVPAVMPSGDAVYYADIQPKHFTVDILVDGKKIGETSYTYGDTELDLSAFSIPERDGYIGRWAYTLTADGATVIAVYEPVSNPTANAVINIANAKENVSYRSIITIRATAKNVPEGYHLALYIGKEKVADGIGTEVSYEYGELKSNVDYSVKVIDEKGNVQKDGSGNALSKDSKITVNAGFFQKLVAFFKALFKTLPKVEVKPQ